MRSIRHESGPPATPTPPPSGTGRAHGRVIPALARHCLRVIGVAIALLTLGATTAGPAWADIEPNNTLDTAQRITVGVNGALAGRIAAPGDQDTFQFSVVAGTRYVAEILDVDNSVGQMSLHAYNNFLGRQNYGTDTCNGTGNVCARIEFTAPMTGDNYLQTHAASPTATGNYRIRVMKAYDHNLVQDTNGEPDDTLALAEPLTVGTAGAITRPIALRTPTFVTVTGDQDTYRFSVVAGTRYVAEILDVDNSEGQMSLHAYNNFLGRQNYGTDTCNGTGNVCARIEFTAPMTGDNYLQTHAVSTTSSGGYSIRVFRA